MEMAWERVDLTAGRLGLPVAIGGSLAPHRLLEAYRHGAFPVPSVHREVHGDDVTAGRIAVFPPAPGETPFALTWWSPPDRPVIPAAGVRLSHRLRGRCAQWVTTCDHAFARVMDACGNLHPRLYRSLFTLHEAGWAHSIEVWDGDELVAGLFGTGMGRVFGVDSAFHRRAGAGEVAFADLGRRLEGTPGALIGFQAPSDDTAALGAKPVAREDYLLALSDIDLPLVPMTGVLTVAGLGDWRAHDVADLSA